MKYSRVFLSIGVLAWLPCLSSTAAASGLGVTDGVTTFNGVSEWTLSAGGTWKYKTAISVSNPVIDAFNNDVYFSVNASVTNSSTAPMLNPYLHFEQVVKGTYSALWNYHVSLVQKDPKTKGYTKVPVDHPFTLGTSIKPCGTGSITTPLFVKLHCYLEPCHNGDIQTSATKHAFQFITKLSVGLGTSNEEFAVLTGPPKCQIGSQPQCVNSAATYPAWSPAPTVTDCKKKSR